MRLEIPVCKRCCCCVPLRYGIITLGYLNLVFSIFFLVVECTVARRYSLAYHEGTLYRSVTIRSQIWLLIFLHFLDLVFAIVLLIGLHWKMTRLLRVFYYYAISTTAAAFITFIVVRDDYGKHWELHVLELSLAFCGLVIEVYLILLIRSELKKLKQQARLRFVNHITEIPAQCPRQDEGWNPL